MRFEIGNLQLFGLDLSALLQRWKMGLQDILPTGLADAFVSPAPTVEVIVEQDSIRFVRKGSPEGVDIVTLQSDEIKLATDGALKTEIIRGIKASQLQLCIVVPEEHVMRRRITLPKLARRNLRNVVSFQIGRLTPFSANQLFFDVIELATKVGSSDVIEVELIAVLKTTAQAWIDEVERLTDLTVSRLTVQSIEQQARAHTVNLLEKLRTRNAWWLRLNYNSMLLVGLILLIVIAAVTPVLKLRGMVTERKQEILVIEQRVADLQIKRETLEHDLAALNYVLQQRGAEGLPSRVLEELTRIIPDRIYINRLSIQNQTVVLSGIGTDLVDLIELLNSSPLFEDAKFTASITQGGGGQNVFSASVKLTTAVDGQK